MKKVIIVDDESAGRKLIREYLEDYPELVLMGKANNGVDAIKAIREFEPDLVFLDIQMPGMSGFEVLTHLDEIPQIIFSTAYDQYALRAFEVHAVDYLLKPYTKERFHEAVQRVLKAESTPSLGTLTESLLQDKQTFPERILVQSGRRLINLAVENIIRIEADGDYSRLITEEGFHLSNYGIGKVEERLDPEVFIRVHRSSIININRVLSVDKYASSYDVKMQNGDVVRVSRGYMDRIKELMF